jgi:receptor protein-tyrosine kinase
MDNPEVIDGNVSAEVGSAVAESGSANPLRVATNMQAIVAANSAAGESLSALRNFLISQHMQNGRRALAICAPHADSGCTFLATNLALAMAQAGVNTLLIDGNLRSPGVQHVFTTADNTPGLADFLGADDDQPPFVVANARPNLSIIYAGKAEDASDLLARQKLKLLINESVRSFDLTIVDCPPGAHFGDARRLASLMRHALVVARRDHSFSSDIKTLVKELQADGTHVVGTFLNILD